jgi:hypothetical protein
MKEKGDGRSGMGMEWKKGLKLILVVYSDKGVVTSEIMQ